MSFQHKKLAAGRWQALPFIFQMANIGSEVMRAIDWRKRDAKNSQDALFRALELIDLSVGDPKNRKHLFEISRIRECLLNYFFGLETYGFTDKAWKEYFYSFAYAQALALDKRV